MGFSHNATWTVSPQPFVKYGVSVGVEQDKDGVVGGQVSLSSSSIQKQMGQVVEAPHYGVVVPLGGAVTYQSNINNMNECCKKNVGRIKLKKHAFDGVPEALRGGRVVRWCVKSVHLQTISNILGLWETLDHGPVHISSWISSDGRCLCV